MQQSAASRAIESVNQEAKGDGKRQIKPYGKRQDSSGSLSRSRSATKELECKLIV